VIGGIVAAAVLFAATAALGTPSGGSGVHPFTPAAQARTTTPIKHVVVLFDENISFDHYFGTYPKAANTDGTTFHARPGTPAPDGLSKRLREHNPNQYNPNRLSHDHALTCDQDHSYGHEQKAFDAGRMDRFVQETGHDTCTGQPILFGEPGLVMDYFDGNTVTGLWNYAQHYTLNDNSYGSAFGPSTPGAIELASGQTHGIYAIDPDTRKKVTDASVVSSPDANGVGTMTGDPQPAFDDCANTNRTAHANLGVLTGRNVGDLLNRKRVSWGFFQGGFRPTSTKDGYAVCGAAHANIGGVSALDYLPHHEPFQFYSSTANEKHQPPVSARTVGDADRANHQYDLTDFDAALAAGHLPSVSFLKAPAYQDGHAGYSDPLDEQRFLVDHINAIQRSPDWRSTAIVVAYDDSDGWYDHRFAGVANGSTDPAQDDPALCGKAPAVHGYQDRCGPGPRLPMMVISPYAKPDHIDHTRTEQTSVLRFIEDNWGLGRIGDGSFDARAGSLRGMFDFRRPHAGRLILDPSTGAS
jgi:phospholipase C